MESHNDAMREVNVNSIRQTWINIVDTEAGLDEALPVLEQEFYREKEFLQSNGVTGAVSRDKALDFITKQISERYAPQVFLAQFERNAKARYLSAGGSELDWLKDWPVLKSEYLRQQATNDSSNLRERKHESASRSVRNMI